MREIGPKQPTRRNLRRNQDSANTTAGGKRPTEPATAEAQKQVSQAYAGITGSGRLGDIADQVDYIESINPGFSGRVSAAMNANPPYDEIYNLTLDDIYYHSVLENDSWKTERDPDPTDPVLHDCLKAMEDIAEKHNLTASIMCAGMAEAIALTIKQCLRGLTSSEGTSPTADA